MKFGLLMFYGISAIIGYLMPNIAYIYIYIYIWIVNTFYNRYTQLNDQTIQFSISQQS